MTTPPPTQPATRPDLAVWRSGLALSRKTQREALDVDSLHQLVRAGFSHHPAPAGSDRLPHVLFAAARNPPRPTGSGPADVSGPQRLLVQSPEPPDWHPLLNSGQLTDAAVSFVEQSYAEGDHIALRTIANPTYRDLATRQRTALTDTSDCANWLHRHLTNGGLDLAPHHISVSSPVRLTGRKDSHRITVVSREFQARATVRDTHRLHTLLAEGVGPAKPYGCGLLLARPLP